MAITKEVKYDRIEVVGDNNAVQLREATILKENGVELTRTFHRKALVPGTDVSGEPEIVRNLCAAVWTDEVVKAWEASIAKSEEEAAKIKADEG